MTTQPIREFKGQHRWLSNFWPCQISIGDGRIYPSVEHAYQAMKTLVPTERDRIAAAATPGQAKQLGRNVTMRPDWEEKKLLFMRLLLGQKFSDPDLMAKLLATGDAELIEGNRWNDKFWGKVSDGYGDGENHLGRLLMKVREELKFEADLMAETLSLGE